MPCIRVCLLSHVSILIIVTLSSSPGSAFCRLPGAPLPSRRITIPCPLPISMLGLRYKIYFTEEFCDIGEDSADARRLEVGLEWWLVQFGRCGGGDPSFGNLRISAAYVSVYHKQYCGWCNQKSGYVCSTTQSFSWREECEWRGPDTIIGLGDILNIEP